MSRVVAPLLAVMMVAGLSGCSRADASDKVTLTAYFDKAISLYASSSVRVLGLPAGKVKDVDTDGTRVKVILEMSGDIPLPADVNATLVPNSLIGERYVQLFPAWTEGQPRAKDGDVIPLERTTIPVEPDEALAAVKQFLDTLDPEATGQLVQNLADDVEGNGEGLNRALAGIANLTTTFAEKDQELVRIVDNFDDFTATLRTRESQLGRVMDRFAELASLLAEERKAVETLVRSLADVSKTGFDLVSEHASRLDTDLTTLTHLLQSVQVNMDNVLTLLDAGPILVAGEDLDGKTEGLLAAYDPAYHHIDLRSVVSPTVGAIFGALGLEAATICLPVDVECVPTPGGTTAKARPAGPTAAAPRQVPAQPPTTSSPATPSTSISTSTTTAPEAPTTTTPVDAIVDLLSSGVDATPSAGTAQTGARSGWLARAARALVEMLG